ncbi:MAG: hypothetical protein HY314_11740 [Acidobacteria bacterium]|nr:hypothetical protein [Acidobacteriota bacterium]
MKRLFILFVVFGLVGMLALPSFPTSVPTTSALAAQDGVTDDPTTTRTINLADLGTDEIMTISGNIASRGGTVLFIGEDSVEKTVNIVADSPTLVTIETNWTNRESDLDVYLYRVGDADPTTLAEANVFNSAASILGSAVFPENIGPNVLLPGQYVLGITNFECDTCGQNDTPFDSPATDFTVKMTVGGKTAEVNVDNGILGILRYRTGLGRTYVNRFSLGDQLGLSAPADVTVTGVRVLLFNPSTLGVVGRPDIPGQQVRFIAFTAPKGTTTPPDNPSLVLDRVLTVPGADGFIDFTLDPPLVVNSDQELLLGYFVADPANNGMHFNIETANPTGRSFFTGGPGTSTAVLSGWVPDEGTSTAAPGGNLMLRLLVAR